MSRIFIIGGQRCGSTYLAHLLDQHPDVCLAKPLRPEPKYFLGDGRPQDHIDRYERRFFSHCASKTQVKVEKSTSYLEYPHVARRIKEAFPEAQIAVILRHPIDRALSHYQFSRQNGLESLPFEQAIEQEPERLASGDYKGRSVSPFAYLARGRYERYLSPWLDCFGRDRLHIFVLETLVSGIDFRAKVFASLGLIPIATHDIVINESVPIPDSLHIGSELAHRLTIYFSGTMQHLNTVYGLDLSRWEGKWL